jgi:hypothetical protein
LPELQGLLFARLFQDRFNPYHMQSAKIGDEGRPGLGLGENPYGQFFFVP